MITPTHSMTCDEALLIYLLDRWCALRAQARHAHPMARIDAQPTSVNEITVDLFSPVGEGLTDARQGAKVPLKPSARERAKVPI